MAATKIDHIELIVNRFESVYVRATGRTVLNLRDPDGWRLQLVDAARRAPDLTSAH